MQGILDHSIQLPHRSDELLKFVSGYGILLNITSIGHYRAPLTIRDACSLKNGLIWIWMGVPYIQLPPPSDELLIILNSLFMEHNTEYYG